MSSGNGSKAHVQALTSTRIEDILDEAFAPLRAFRQILEDDHEPGDSVDVTDVAVVLGALNNAAMWRAQELLEDAAQVSS